MKVHQTIGGRDIAGRLLIADEVGSPDWQAAKAGGSRAALNLLRRAENRAASHSPAFTMKSLSEVGPFECGGVRIQALGGRDRIPRAERRRDELNERKFR